ncbi:uncharacterized protein LOC110735933 [Chenopodium quinoa]|uniref:uncharacterized protein LOC110735933 n=1 Tax=Chenopodium quinoa TaxID=63459 RepID=UPI000B77F87A|nr:uncharacterized protein LOC110735933 [Chenopodium quinoa]
MHQPPGFVDKRFPGHVCRLRKALYGLKQAPRAWYQRFANFLLQMGFVIAKSDNSLFIFRHGKDMAYLLLYVDDIVLVTYSNLLRDRIISHLRTGFPMTDLGPLNYFLGIVVTRTPSYMFLSQQKYAKEILERAGMASCKPAATPVETQSKLSAETGPQFHDPTLYRSLAGALQYLTFARPDIAYVVQQVCLFMHDPKQAHYDALKRILRYIQGSIDHGLHLYPSSSMHLITYTDADWGRCLDTRRSTSSYCCFLGDNFISWSSKRQPTLSKSSAEAKYRGIANVVVEHQRTKHIEMDIHFVREKVALGHVRVLHVPSHYQFADIFTKGLSRQLFLEFRSSLSVRLPPATTAGV